MVTKVVAMFEVVSRKVKQLENNRMTDGTIDDEKITLVYLVLGYPGKSDQDAATIKAGEWMEEIFGKLGMNKPVDIDYKSSFTASLAGAKELAKLALTLAPNNRVVVGFAGVLPPEADKLEAIRQEIVAMPRNVFVMGVDTALAENVDPTRTGRVDKWTAAMQRECRRRLILLGALDLVNSEVFVATVRTLEDWLTPARAAV